MTTPTSQQYFKILFPHLDFDWKLIYLLPRILTKNTSLRAFQYNVLNNVLYLNHKLFQFRVRTISLCSYCNQHDETVQHIFSTCNQVILLWTEIKLYFLNDIKLIALCPQISILGFTNADDRCFITQNLILLFFNFYVYKSRARILNNILFLNKKLFVFQMKNTPLSYFCNKEEETPLHIFSECTSVIYLWQQLATFFKNNLILPALTPQNTFLGLWSDKANHDESIINHVLLHVYNSREKHRVNKMDLLIDIKEIKKTEYCLSSNSEKKERYMKTNGA